MAKLSISTFAPAIDPCGLISTNSEAVMLAHGHLRNFNIELDPIKIPQVEVWLPHLSPLLVKVPRHFRINGGGGVQKIAKNTNLSLI
jgi:hypothetical protein